MKSQSCAEGHNFQVILDADTRKTEADGTGIYRTIFCTKCGTTKVIRVALWAKKGEVK